MKKLFLMMAAAIATLAMASCGNDPTPNEEPEEDKLVLEDGTIVLNSCAGGIYFGDFWKESIADYYFLLTNDTQIGQTEKGFDVPMTPGRWLLYIDLWGAVSEDHTNPIVPEGTYRWGAKRGAGVLTAEYTLATENVEKVGEQYRIVDHLFSDGTVVVEHTAEGYKLSANMTTTEGKEMKFIFEGPITMEDMSNDEEFNPGIKDNITISPVVARGYKYASYDNCDNFVLMLFDSENLTEDLIHVAEPGMKLHLDFYNTPGAGYAGTYKAGTVNSVGIITKEPGVFYPGRMYGSGTAFGSFLERVNDDEEWSVEFSVLEDGTLTITENGDGTYTVVGDFTTATQTTVLCNWTGIITPHN